MPFAVADRRHDAFGLALDMGFEAPGLDSGQIPPELTRKVTSEVISAAEHTRAWDARTAVRLWEARSTDGRLETAIDRNPSGFRLTSRDRGRYLLTVDGAHIGCTPPPGGSAWLRFFNAQVLPLAALLSGMEVFHASAVSLGGEALGLIGPSGAGKTTLAMELVSRGGTMLTDDVLAIEPQGEQMTAHRGPATLSPRHSALTSMDDGDLAALGPILARGRKGPLISLPRDPSPRPLTRLYFIRRLPGGGSPRVEPLLAGPRLLLGSSFNFVVRSRERLVRQLDVCSRLAESSAAYEVFIPAGCSPASVAGCIVASARSTTEVGSW